jgi:asparagine synthase (glutamine-hydrolysing)
MCGITGFFSAHPRANERLLLTMNDRIVRRGPDGAGHYCRDGVGLAMRRLAIIDLEGGRQPIFNETGGLAIVFNGEIYNYRELRAGLVARGHTLSTHSDTEVIVHLYEEHGLDAPKLLDGMFAFAIWDRDRDRVVLARDRLGIKPLFYAARPEGFFFGSEIKSLLATGLVPDDVDLQAVDEYLTYTNVPVPRSIYSAVRQLPPGHVATVARDGTLDARAYWTPPAPVEGPGSEREWIDSTEKVLRDAVESHMVSDVPIGAFLSGGVDSGLMVALMADILGKPIECFTVSFRDAGAAFIDERGYARSIATRYGLKHHEIDVAPKLDDILAELVEAFDQPFADDSVVPSYYVCKIAAQHVKVALTGLGGDELFAGYRRHLGLALGERYARLPRWLRDGVVAPLVRRLPEATNSSDVIDHLKRFTRAGGAPAAVRYQDSLATLQWRERAALYTPRVAAAVTPDATANVVLEKFLDGRGLADGMGTAVGRALRTDLGTYLVDDILQLTDRLSMWHSLELRVPYLDHRLVEHAARAPVRFKVRGMRQKVLLKKLAERWLPREVIYHKKQGFEAPMGRWLRGPLLPYFDSVVTRASVADAGLFRFEEIERLRGEHVSGRRKHSKVLFSILMLQAWWRARTGHAAV